MTTQTSSVLILGANGRLGAAAVQAFAAAGWQVRAQARCPGDGWPPGVRPVVADALDADALCRAAEGVAVIVNGLNPPYTEWTRRAPPLARSALAAAKASGALLMFPGNVYNYGSDLPARLSLDTPENANHDKARVRCEIERQMLAAEGVDSVVLRAGDYFGGARRGSWFDLAIVSAIKKGQVVYPGPMDIVHAWAYLPDFAASFVRLAALRGQLRGANRFHFAGHALTGEQLHHALETLCQRPLKLRGLPWRMMQLSAPFSAMTREVLKMRYLWQRPHALDDTELKQLLGDVPHTPLESALSDALFALGMPRPS